MVRPTAEAVFRCLVIAIVGAVLHGHILGSAQFRADAGLTMLLTGSLLPGLPWTLPIQAQAY
jgi:hypothetical protein